jgi:hypothetical protein
VGCGDKALSQQTHNKSVDSTSFMEFDFLVWDLRSDECGRKDACLQVSSYLQLKSLHLRREAPLA